MANSLLKVDSPPSFDPHSEASSTAFIFLDDAIAPVAPESFPTLQKRVTNSNKDY